MTAILRKENPERNERNATKIVQVKMEEEKVGKCEACDLNNLSPNELKAHLVSTLHHFKVESSKSEQKVHYVIPEANRGFQIMLGSGWKSNKGLGPPGKSGKLFPVKTVLKRDRYGLGLPEAAKDKKVTHFQPFDVQSVKNPKTIERQEREATLSKKARAKRKAVEKVKETNFRREFL